MNKLFIFFLMVFCQVPYIYADSLSERYEKIMKKNRVEIERIEPKEISLAPFDWSILKEKLAQRNFTDDQKLQIFSEYYSETRANTDPINLSEVLNESIPYGIKKKLILSKRINYTNNVSIDNFIQLRDFSLRHDCIECIKKSYLIGNRNINITLRVVNIYKYQLLNTYYFIPDGGKGNLFAFLDNKKDGIKFGMGDVLETNCNTSFHKDNNSFIFWHCRLKKVNNTLLESNYKKTNKKYKIYKTCGSIEVVQKKLKHKGYYQGNVDGRFGQEIFFSLLKFNGHGDLDDETCNTLKSIELPDTEDSTSSLSSNFTIGNFKKKIIKI